MQHTERLCNRMVNVLINSYFALFCQTNIMQSIANQSGISVT